MKNNTLTINHTGIRLHHTLVVDNPKKTFKIYKKDGTTEETYSPFYNTARKMMDRNSSFISTLIYEFIDGQWIQSRCAICNGTMYHGKADTHNILGKTVLVHKYCKK